MASLAAVGFVGLDEFTLDMAASLLRSGCTVQAFEKSEPLVTEFLKLGGCRCSSPMEAGKDVTALVMSIYEAEQIDTMIFGHEGALKGLQEDAVIILNSAILPSHIQKLQKQDAICENLYIFEGEVGAGRKIKTVVKLLEGVHYAAALEAISLCSKAGIHPWIVYDIISNSAGNSWIFKNHVPQLLKGIHTKHKFLNTFVHSLVNEKRR